MIQSADNKINLRELEISGSSKYVVASAIAGTDWVLCAVVDKSTILSPLRSLLWMLAFAGVSIAVLGAGLANVALSALLKGLFGLRDALTTARPCPHRQGRFVWAGCIR